MGVCNGSSNAANGRHRHAQSLQSCSAVGSRRSGLAAAHVGSVPDDIWSPEGASGTGKVRAQELASHRFWVGRPQNAYGWSHGALQGRFSSFVRRPAVVTSSAHTSPEKCTEKCQISHGAFLPLASPLSAPICVAKVQRSRAGAAWGHRPTARILLERQTPQIVRTSWYCADNRTLVGHTRLCSFCTRIPDTGLSECFLGAVRVSLSSQS